MVIPVCSFFLHTFFCPLAGSPTEMPTETPAEAPADTPQEPAIEGDVQTEELFQEYATY